MSLFTAEELVEAVRSRRAWAQETLFGWVPCASTLGNEQEAQLYIEGVYRALGLSVRREPVLHKTIEQLPGYSPALMDYDNRYNVVGTHQPDETSGRSLILNGHVDVVSPSPEALWSAPPFEPKLLTDSAGETWIQGRGAGDMKGGSVSALWAFAALQTLNATPSSKIIFQSCIEEECTGNGTLSLIANGAKAEACIIPEPFDQTVLAAQAGVVWFEIHILGKTTHVLETGRGVNAIDKAHQLYQVLRDELEAPLNHVETLPPAYRNIPHPANLNLGVIHGGDWPSTVAGDCTLRFRMGLLPGMSCAELKKQIADVVEGFCRRDAWLTQNPPKLVFKGFQAEPCEVDLSSDFGQCLSDAHREMMGASPAPLYATCTTDVRFYNLYAGIPATCYGPKAVNIHGADERVSLDSMEKTALVIARFIEKWCGVAKRS